MHEMITRLRELNEPVPQPIPRPTTADVSRVEQTLGFKLPSDFVELQLGAGDVVFGTYEPVTLALNTGHTYIELVANEAWSQGVPREYLPICEDNGNYFCLTPLGMVVYWAHDGVSNESWPSLACWVRDVWLGESAL